MNRRDALVATLSLTSPFAASFASAQTGAWPSQTLRIVVPSPPASVTDITARVIAERLFKELGQPVVVENRPGAGTNLAADYVARQAPDGYCILLTQNTFAVNASFHKSLPYHPVKDFEPVALIGKTPLIVVVHSDSPARSIKGLTDLGKKKNLKYATAGLGSPHHIGALLLAAGTGAQMTPVPYRGSSAAALAVIQNEVDFAFSSIPVILPHIQSGRLRALGVGEDQRSPVLPDVPAIREVVPGVELNVWLGVLAPAGTPKEIIRRLNSEINKAAMDPALETKFQAAGLQLEQSTPEEFARVIRSDLAKYAKLVADHGIEPR